MIRIAVFLIKRIRFYLVLFLYNYNKKTIERRQNFLRKTRKKQFRKKGQIIENKKTR